jgi:hypothetical protein
LEARVADFFLPPELTVELAAYTQRLQEQVQVAAMKASNFLHERVVAKARMDPQWASLADNIEVWSQDGRLIVGVRHQDFVSQAFALEYGDEVRPPTPLFRTLAEDMREAGQVMDQSMGAGSEP